MSNSSGIIKRSVNFRNDVRNVLGETSARISALCTSPNINIWSRHKPIRVATIKQLTEQYFIDHNFGLTFRYFTELTTLKNNIATSAWTYERPNGTPSAPYRIGDFDGYNHYAECPLPYLGDKETVYTENSMRTLPIPVFLDGDPSDKSAITLDDLHISTTKGVTSLMDMYLGVYMKIGNTEYFMTNTEKGITALNIPWSGNALTGTYDVWLFASDIPVNTREGSASASGTYIPLNQSSVKQVVFEKSKQGGITQNWSGEINVDTGEGTIYINFTTTGVTRLENVWITIVAGSPDNIGDSTKVLATLSVGTIEFVDGKISKTVPFRCYGINWDNNKRSEIYAIMSTTNNIIVSPIVLDKDEQEEGEMPPDA